MSKWKEYQIGDFAELQGGFAFSSNFFKDNGVPLIRISNISNNGIYNNFAYLPDKFLKKHISFSVNVNDIVIAMSGATTGKNCRINVKNLPALVNQRVGRFIIRRKEIGNNEFLYFFVNSVYFQNEILIDAIGGAQPNISSGQIEKIKISLPPLPHQRKIARILTTIDNVIEKTEEAIAKYKAIKQGMMHDLFTRGIDTETGKLRPTKEEAPHLYKKTELGWIPKEWEVEKIDKLLINRKGAIKIGPFGSQLKSSFFVRKGYKVYGQENIYENDFNIGWRRIDQDRFNHLKSCELFSNDIVISMMGTIGKCAIVPQNIEKGIMDSHLLRIQLDNNKYSSNLLMFQIAESNHIKSQIRKLSIGGIMDGLSMGVVKKINFIYPSKDEQKKITNKLVCILGKIETEQKQLSKLQKLKQGLMQDLLTGKKEVEPDKEDYDE